MSMLLNLLRGISKAQYKCRNCGQKSSAIRGKGSWETIGKYNQRPLIKCTKCGAGLVLGMVINSYISSQEIQRLEKFKEESLSKNSGS